MFLGLINQPYHYEKLMDIPGKELENGIPVYLDGFAYSGIFNIQPIIKNNIDIFCLFKYTNLNDILKKFYPLVSGIMLEDQFKEIYLHSTKDKFNFLTITMQVSYPNKIDELRREKVYLKQMILLYQSRKK